MHFTALVGALALAGAATAAPARRAPEKPIALKINKSHLPAHHKRDLQARKEELIDWNRDYQYNIELDIGTPAQTFAFVLDTGSSDLWAMDKDCKTDVCLGQSKPNFDRNASSTFKDLGTPFKLNYGSGGVQGSWGQDRVSMDGVVIENQDIGVVNFTTVNLFKIYQTQGILGLGWQYGNHPKTIWQRIIEEGNFETPGFGIYLERDLRPRDSNQGYSNGPGGEFMMGGYNHDLYTGDLTFVPKLEMNRTFWTIQMDGINVNGNEVTTAANNVVFVDSGSTMSYGSIAQVRELYEQIPGAFNTTQKGGGVAWGFPCANLASIDLKFKFGGVEYPIYPGDLSYEKADNGTTCLGTIQGQFIPQALGVMGIDWILGANFLKNVYSAFQHNPPAVGFAPLTDAANHRDESLLHGGPVVTSAGPSATDGVAPTPTAEVSATGSPTSTDEAAPSVSGDATLDERCGPAATDSTDSDANDAAFKRSNGPIKVPIHRRPN